MSDVEIFRGSSPVPAESFVSGDKTLEGAGQGLSKLRAISVGGPLMGPGVILADPGGPGLPAGVVIAFGGTAPGPPPAPSKTPGPPPPPPPAVAKAQLAIADGSAAGNALGIVTSPTSANEIIEYSVLLAILLTIDIWDSVTGQSGGLVPGHVYYLSQTTPGHITDTKPVSGQVVQIGIALSPTVMAAQILQLGTIG